MSYEKNLEELIRLLIKSGETHWAKYFTDVLATYQNGKKCKSYEKTLDAYGGMGSFNDVTFNPITPKEYDETVFIRSYL